MIRGPSKRVKIELEIDAGVGSVYLLEKALRSRPVAVHWLRARLAQAITGFLEDLSGPGHGSVTVLRGRITEVDTEKVTPT